MEVSSSALFYAHTFSCMNFAYAASIAQIMPQLSLKWNTYLSNGATISEMEQF
jgi:hypothetical protein